jgi:hypothetical protein
VNPRHGDNDEEAKTSEEWEVTGIFWRTLVDELGAELADAWCRGEIGEGPRLEAL